MAYILRMPRLSDTMQEGELLKWLRKEGDRIEPGDLIAEVETDKATMEFECYQGGVLAKRIAREGETLAVGGAIAIVVEEGETDISELLKMIESEKKGTPRSTAGQKPAETAAAKPAPTTTERRLQASAIPAPPLPLPTDPHGWIKASPLARALAEEKGIDLTKVQGSGPFGRIIRQDVEALAGGSLKAVTGNVEIPKPFQKGEPIKLSMMRKAIVRTMLSSKPGVPHYYLEIDINADPIEALREKLKKVDLQGVKVSMTAFLIKAAAIALKEHPQVNTVFQSDSLTGDHLLRCSHADIGVAVDIEEGGLITPVLRNCEEKNLLEIAKELSSLAERARGKKLKEEEYKGATFAISNLGMFGVANFTAVIVPPAAAMLAVGRTREVPVVRNGKIKVGKEVWMTLSCDHRVVDGAVGARFLKTFKELLEKPDPLVVGLKNFSVGKMPVKKAKKGKKR
ncbi:MAG: dihydrolipoamide acetyltransferase family protein [Deltaproteobacteria bacterium]|nr:dihydrolipoamide acetyltransferase family protein [Deltaproteobacteria bacterium]